ncbi:DegT/DnrJ/EryC1/StrS family aminotransferase [Candidatus Thiodiazotropha endoloripes]|uniref:DegT/DnrJ/EryC1/StrS family aminotransferase n=1 Tax=Candidatus Thiodiazotropha endoloripes TaxID=1818881 RepID=UPI00083D5779|nr:DegT/DnrJ/EryC1/StrS family aminotransferase [Candidatus Thiodiazotropha endoloripes]MCG7912381.1 DegT/DnrJ/EryC1/StrS family aminotransferase [Candidatus Thiodiazotropha weberae]
MANIVSGKNHNEVLLQLAKGLLGMDAGFLFSTGRGAMTALLAAVKLQNSDNDRNEVIVPAYTCYSVASSVINAGLKIRLCDIDPRTLSYDEQQLRQIDFSRVAAIISANLYGLPNNLPMLEKLSKSEGFLLIDDAAQSLNAKIDGRYLGSFGDAGILSLDKGKNVTSIQGGLAVTNHPGLAELLSQNVERLDPLSFKRQAIEFIKVVIYYFFLNPYAYKLPANISFSGLGETRFETDVEVSKYPAFLSSLATAQFNRIDQITQSRTQRGFYYDEALQSNQSITKIDRLVQTEPAYLRYPLLVHDANQRSELLDEYREYGISASYPKSLNCVDEIAGHLVGERACPAAEVIARQIVTLPTHAYVRETDMNQIIEILAGL